MGDNLQIQKNNPKAANKNAIAPKSSANKALTVALVDDFSNTIPIGISSELSLSEIHGNIGKRFLEEGLPKGSKIETFNTNIANDNVNSFDEIDKALNKILENMKKGKKYDAIDLPAADYISFENLSKLLGKNITSQNVAEYKKEIRKLMFNKFSIEEGKVLKKLDEISDRGVPIYTAAGNEGKDFFNMFSLANKINVVGALDKDGQKTQFSADNKLVTDWQPGIFDITEKCDSTSKCGFDYTGDGSIDLYSGKTAPYIIIDYGNTIKGTSFSTSIALTKQFKSKK